MKRPATLPITALATALLVAAAVPAAAFTPPEVYVYLGQNYVQGHYWQTGVPLTATLRNGKGEFKGQCTIGNTGTCSWDGLVVPGCWSCSFSQGASAPAGSLAEPIIKPGDTVTVEQGAVTETSPRIADVEITGIQPADDTVSGLVRPVKGRFFVRIEPRGTFTPSGWVNSPLSPWYDTTGKIAPDGSFVADVSKTANLRRGDYGFAGYEAGVFRVGQRFVVPYLQVEKDDLYLWLAGNRDHEYTIQLLNRFSEVKGEVLLQRGSYGVSAPAPGAPVAQGYGNIVFRRADGTPIRIRQGHRIRVIGIGGFTLTVPRMDIDFPGGAEVAYRTLRNRAVEYCGWAENSGWCYNGGTDGGGRLSWTYPGGVDVDRASLAVYTDGSWIRTYRLRAP